MSPGSAPFGGRQTGIGGREGDDLRIVPMSLLFSELRFPPLGEGGSEVLSFAAEKLAAEKLALDGEPDQRYFQVARTSAAARMGKSGFILFRLLFVGIPRSA